MTKAIAAASRADFIKTSLRIRNSTGWDSSVKATLSTRSANQAESFPAYSNEITVGKVRLPSAGDRIAITTPQTPSHFLRASRARGIWQRERESNPRWPLRAHAGFQDR